MSKRTSLLFFFILLFFSGNLCAQTWSSIINFDRAIDWSSAGVVGGIPSATWTQCGTTKSAGASAATINSAIQACSANTYVQLGAGTFNLTTGIVMKTGVVLRGMGADQTFLNFSGVDSCYGAYAAICMGSGSSSDYFADPKMQPGGANSATWSSGYAKGSTQIVLNNIGSNGISVGKYIMLDQASDSATNSGYFNCEGTSQNPPCSSEGGTSYSRVVGGLTRWPTQIVKVTGCSPSCNTGSTFTISPGVYSPNVSSGRSPGAWWPPSTIQNSGIENLSIDASNSGGNKNIQLYNAANVWISGIRSIRDTATRSNIQMHAVTHATIQNSYFYGSQTGHSQNYGVETLIASDCLIQNNIWQATVVPNLLHAATGNVYLYNYSINNTFDGGMSPFAGGHSGGVQYNLFEGNIGQKVGADVTHGNSVMNTVYRNYLLGKDTGKTSATNACYLNANSRYWNIIGNVLGTPAYHKAYENGSDTSIYALGSGEGGVPLDSVVASTLMRWGNYDTVNAAVRWQNSEVPTAAPNYPNSVPASQTLPASLYYGSKPSWWPTAKAWPPIGPDVAGGNITNLGGHANTIPAQDCYTNVMGGPVDGSGSVLSFNAEACTESWGGVSSPKGLKIVQ
jgi:hypothetical protein